MLVGLWMTCRCLGAGGRGRGLTSHNTTANLINSPFLPFAVVHIPTRCSFFIAVKLVDARVAALPQFVALGLPRLRKTDMELQLGLLLQ